jgi:histidinol phosphatase-like enzyme
MRARFRNSSHHGSQPPGRNSKQVLAVYMKLQELSQVTVMNEFGLGSEEMKQSCFETIHHIVLHAVRRIWTKLRHFYISVKNKYQYVTSRSHGTT